MAKTPWKTMLQSYRGRIRRGIKLTAESKRNMRELERREAEEKRNAEAEAGAAAKVKRPLLLAGATIEPEPVSIPEPAPANVDGESLPAPTGTEPTLPGDPAPEGGPAPIPGLLDPPAPGVAPPKEEAPPPPPPPVDGLVTKAPLFQIAGAADAYIDWSIRFYEEKLGTNMCTPFLDKVFRPCAHKLEQYANEELAKRALDDKKVTIAVALTPAAGAGVIYLYEYLTRPVPRRPDVGQRLAPEVKPAPTPAPEANGAPAPKEPEEPIAQGRNLRAEYAA